MLATPGTTLGMMLANVPAVYFGNAIVERVPLRIVRVIAALLFLVIGIGVIAEAGGLTGILILRSAPGGAHGEWRSCLSSMS